MACESDRTTRHKRAVASVAGVFILFAPTGLAQATDLTARTIEGSTLQGQYAGISDRGFLRIHIDGHIEQIDLDDLSAVEFTVTPLTDQRDTPNDQAVFYLAPRGLLHGAIADRSDSGVAIGTRFGQSITLPLDRLQAIRFVDHRDYPQAEQLFQAELSHRLPGKDVLITRSSHKPRALRGRMTFLDRTQGGFVFGDRERTFQLDTLYGIVLAKGTGPPDDDDCLVELTDGDSLPGRLAASDAQALGLNLGQGQTVTFPVDQVRRIAQRSARVVYLSDLTPTSQQIQGQIHDPWPIRLDRSVSNQPIRLNGRTFDKGIGVHARTELVYTLNGAFEQFCATIGIDDAVRPRGQVIFQVLGDGQPIFDSGPVDGYQPPRDLCVDVAAVGQLTLLVDYGPQADLADHADWADARLIKPRSTAPKGRSEKTAP